MTKTISLLAFLLLSVSAFSQKFHISGVVSDASNGECIIGVNVFLSDRSTGTATDQKGYFNLVAELPAELCFSCIGYTDTCLRIQQTGNQSLAIRLQPSTENLQSVEIKAKKVVRPVFNTLTLTAKAIDQIPTLGSRPDIIKAAQQLPGIEPLTEGSSVMLVRGGNPGENLYILDNVPLIYVNHLGGFMSVFNSEMINTMDIYKGGFPAKFGGRLSSIVDLTVKKGNPSRFKGSISAGITDLDFAVEGPGGTKNSSFIITGRKTLSEILMYAASQMAKDMGGQDYNLAYGFHDINAKYTWSPDSKNSFAFNVYEGDDYLSLWKNLQGNGDVEKNSINSIWGNMLVSGQWTNAISPMVFMSNTISFTQYHLKNNSKAHLENSMGITDFFVCSASKLGDASLRSDWKWFASASWTLEYGLQSSYKAYRPNQFTSSYSSTIVSDGANVVDNSLYINNRLRIGHSIFGDIGIRINAYLNDGYSHFAFEPRMNCNICINKSTVNLSAMRVTQNSHLLMTPGSILNNEIWIPADENAKPAFSEQVSMGWQRDFFDGLINTEIDIYYKLLHELTTYREGYGILLGDSDWSNSIVSGGEGKAYGIEMMAKLNLGAWNGYLGYTYSHTNRQFDHINEGKVFVHEYDRPHSINFNMNYAINEKWSLGALWVYQSGLPYTPIIGIQAVPVIDSNGLSDIEEVNIYGERNSARMRDYHRLDLAAKFKTLTEKGRMAEWTFSIYNAYCRQNPFYYYYGDHKGDPISWNQFPDEAATLWQRTFFPVIPSFSYKVWF